MSLPAIEISGLGKQFRLGQPQGASSFRESMARWASLPLNLLSAKRRKLNTNFFWALRNISFQVNPGEVVGIVGRNGAGKSTLLKILTRITDPTEGRGILRGRVGSLLEVGTGFHSELSGRENIFLNGAILGMRRPEIQRNFDAIVAFADVEKFLDTPVKHYSSGMYMRLAFSVAAHLETEILLVDEVLAVGDASFQKKCLNKMETVGRQGRTIFFVSHNMNAVTRLCARAIMLDRGQVFQDGPASQVATTYLRSGLGGASERIWSESQAPGNHIARLRAVRARNEAGQICDSFDIRRPIDVEMDYDVLTEGRVLIPGLHLFNEDGVCICVVHDVSPEWRRAARPVGRYRSAVRIPGNFLAEGMAIVRSVLSTHDPVETHFDEWDAVCFTIKDSLDGDSARGDYAGPMPGIVRPLLPWHTTVFPDLPGQPEPMPNE